LLIALSCSLGATKKRIVKRGRGMEVDIPHVYLRRLHGMYTDWFDRYSLSPILRIDTTKLDYVEDLVDLLELRRTMDRALA
jgi:deoxyadenosine/deoxycytidine kinase